MNEVTLEVEKALTLIKNLNSRKNYTRANL